MDEQRQQHRSIRSISMLLFLQLIAFDYPFFLLVRKHGWMGSQNWKIDHQSQVPITNNNNSNRTLTMEKPKRDNAGKRKKSDDCVFNEKEVGWLYWWGRCAWSSLYWTQWIDFLFMFSKDVVLLKQFQLFCYVGARKVHTGVIFPSNSPCFVASIHCI